MYERAAKQMNKYLNWQSQWFSSHKSTISELKRTSLPSHSITPVAYTNPFNFQDSSLSPQGWQPISGYDYTPEAYTRLWYFATCPFANSKALQAILKQTLRIESSGLACSNTWVLLISVCRVIFSGFESTVKIARALLTFSPLHFNSKSSSTK